MVEGNPICQRTNCDSEATWEVPESHHLNDDHLFLCDIHLDVVCECDEEAEWPDPWCPLHGEGDRPFRLDLGDLDIGIRRDSSLISRNDFAVFADALETPTNVTLVCDDKYMRSLEREYAYNEGFADGLLTGVWTFNEKAYLLNARYKYSVNVIINNILPEMLRLLHIRVLSSTSD